MTIEITTTIRGIPVEVQLGRAEGLGRRSVANFDNLHVVPLRALTRRIGTLRDRRVGEVKRALGWALGWAELKSLDVAPG